LFLLACPGNLDNPPDAYVKPTKDWALPKNDKGNNPPKKDQGNNPPKKDKGGWPTPDQYQPPPPDQWAPPPKWDTGYKPSPFGCNVDAECFGLKCCPTPWGVKLCADTCNW